MLGSEAKSLTPHVQHTNMQSQVCSNATLYVLCAGSHRKMNKDCGVRMTAGLDHKPCLDTATCGSDDSE